MGMNRTIIAVSLLTSLTFGAVFVVFSRPLAAQTTRDTIPNLSGYDSETRQTMELACVTEKMRGPVAYGACLNRQTASLQRSPGIRNAPAPAPAPVHTRPPPPPPPDFNAKSLSLNIGMSEQEVTRVLGTPLKADVGTCGSKTDKPWTCKTWTYGSWWSGIRVTFAEDVGVWRLNDWTVMGN
jgi:hypothetical protein